MRTEKTYRPVMSGQSIWAPGPMRRQTTPRRRPPSRTIPTTVRCHTVSSNLNRPGGNPTNQPVSRHIHSHHLPKPTPHTYPLSAAPSNRPHTYRLSDTHPTQPIPTTHQTRPTHRTGPCTQITHPHSHAVTQSHTPPHTPTPHTHPVPAAQHARRTARSSEHEAAPSTEHGAGSRERRVQGSRAAQSTERRTVTTSTDVRAQRPESRAQRPESRAQRSESSDDQHRRQSTETRRQRTERRGGENTPPQGPTASLRVIGALSACQFPRHARAHLSRGKRQNRGEIRHSEGRGD